MAGMVWLKTENDSEHGFGVWLKIGQLAGGLGILLVMARY